MNPQELSNAGQLFRLLHLSSANLSRTLHVDASLVSKWKSGARPITPRSLFYSEIVDYLLEQNESLGQHILEDFFATLYPDAQSNQPDYLKNCINQMLCSKHIVIPKAYRSHNDALCTAEITVYTGGSGRRSAVSQLLRIAQELKDPVQMTYIDCEQYRWLLEDEAYAKEWVGHMLSLLNRGCKLKMIMHFSMYRDNFIRLMASCSAVLFHPNAEILYHKYYDEDVYWFSFFILDNALSIMGLSMHKNQSHTTVFTDAPSIFQHKSIVDFVSKSCFPMFQIFTNQNIPEFLNLILLQHPHTQVPVRETYYFYHDIPEFIFANEALLLQVLEQNHAFPNEIALCLEIRRRVARAVRLCFMQDSGSTRFLSLFSLPATEAASTLEKVPCPILSFFCGHPISATRAQFQLLLEDEASRILQYPNQISILLSAQEAAKLPGEWCLSMQGEWFAASQQSQIKFSTENTMVSTATISLEQIWRQAPSSRKQRDLVAAVLRNLIQ